MRCLKGSHLPIAQYFSADSLSTTFPIVFPGHTDGVVGLIRSPFEPVSGDGVRAKGMSESVILPDDFVIIFEPLYLKIVPARRKNRTFGFR